MLKFKGIGYRELGIGNWRKFFTQELSRIKTPVMIQWNFREDLQQRALSSSGGHQALRPYALI
ncbi:MAG: hypothetical protein FWC43_14690, partial [Planctomycetaceae bacterium]|nr:hypothetical protein [Planctomycetaceae bacterium]